MTRFFDNGLNLRCGDHPVVKVVVVFVIVLVSVLFMVMYERKAIARLGVRYGPNRAGPERLAAVAGRRHQAALQGGLRPTGADKFIYRLAPYLMLVPVFVAFSIVPIGGTITDRRSHDPRCSWPTRRGGSCSC